MITKILLTTIFASTLSLAQQANDDNPSIAEIARQSRDSRQSTPAKLVTNATLRGMQHSSRVATFESESSETGPAVAEETTDESQSAQESTDSEASEEKSPTFFSKEFSEARLDFKNAVNEQLVLQLRMNNLQNSFMSESDGSTQDYYRSQLQETQLSLEENQQVIDQAQQALDELRREAMGAGFEAGEIRKWVGELPEVETIEPEE